MNTKNYFIRELIVDVPAIELPVESKVVTIEHHSAYSMPGGGAGDLEFPECWKVVWLEPTPIEP